MVSVSAPRTTPGTNKASATSELGKAAPATPGRETSTVSGLPDAYEDFFQIPSTPAELASEAGRRAVAPFLRTPEEPIQDPAYAHTYLTNLSRAVHQDFLPVLGDRALSHGYAGALREQHRTLMENYDGFYRVRPALQVEGGVFNFEVGRGVKVLMMFQGPPASPAEFDATSADYRYRIEGLPPEAWPQVTSGARPALLSPPKEQMPRVLQHLGALLDKASSALTPHDEVLTALADYLYVGTVSQPFPRGNVSLFMAHVNVLLWERGLPTIPVRDLDLKALRSTQEQFRAEFIKAVSP